MKSLSPNLLVQDVNASVSFYENVLGFQLIQAVPEQAPFQWAMVARGSVSFMFQTAASMQEELPQVSQREQGGSLSFYILTDEVEALYDKVMHHGEIISELHTTFYGHQEFAMYDPDGYILVLAQERNPDNQSA